MSVSGTVGVVVSCSCFKGTYGEFDNLRLVWAQVAGYGITDFSHEGGPKVPNIPYDRFSEADMMGEWPEGAPDDPLIILLAHMETAGRIKAEHCGYLADRLEEIQLHMSRGSIITPSWVLLTQQFVQGLRYAASHHQDVHFGKD